MLRRSPPQGAPAEQRCHGCFFHQHSTATARCGPASVLVYTDTSRSTVRCDCCTVHLSRRPCKGGHDECVHLPGASTWRDTSSLTHARVLGSCRQAYRHAHEYEHPASRTTAHAGPRATGDVGENRAPNISTPLRGESGACTQRPRPADPIMQIHCSVCGRTSVRAVPGNAGMEEKEGEGVTCSASRATCMRGCRCSMKGMPAPRVA